MRSRRSALTCAVLLLAAGVVTTGGAKADEAKISTLKQLFDRLGKCWKSPEMPPDHAGMEITVLVAFKRDGTVMGQPKITYESAYASADERAAYELAVAGTLQRCTPMPFTDELGGAVAGRPLRMRYDARRTKSI